jgi:uncharacterized protein YgbK (DUF1537 family)
VGIAIVDAITNNDLLELGPAIADLRLVTAGSGVAIALPANWGFHPSPDAAALPAATGLQAIVSGSVSVATNTQVAEFHRTGRPSFQVDPLRIAAGQDVVTEALGFADQHLASGPVLFYSTQAPSEVRAVQNALGAAEAGSFVEDTLAQIAAGLVESGVGQLVVAGGETSGAVVQQLGIDTMRIGPRSTPACPGVPQCFPTGAGSTSRSSPATSAPPTSSRRRLQHWSPLHERPHGVRARRDMPRRGKPVHARLRTRQRRQHQRAGRRRLPRHADGRANGVP